MSVIQVMGAEPLAGEIWVQGSKNAVLPVMAAAILHSGVSVIENVPKIQDVTCMMGILSSLGCEVTLEGRTLRINAAKLSGYEIERKDMGQMRSSMMLVGPLLARFGRAVAFAPGGCSIGKRPVDLHLSALRCLGARVVEMDGRMEFEAEGLEGGNISFPYPSVGATENAVMAAVFAKGRTRILGCAREPEIVELCRFLRHMGARIFGEGTSLIEIEGGGKFRDTQYRIAGDRIVAGSYLAAVLCTGGEICVRGVEAGQLQAVLAVLEQLGAKIFALPDGVALAMKGRPRGSLFVKTAPYPAFPTDMQSLLLAVFARAEGENRIEETVFEGRFQAARELKKFGAYIQIEGNCVTVRGRARLRGAVVEAPDLRGGAALVLAALAAEGRSEIHAYEHIARGYASICEDLQGLGAKIRLSE
ncbi:MAG: UDP-N-acetylglucosamine 1-carboxyvinyltransferase [bacterium]|nr:UDP-N-acetylglucosamine 1-carboxyvinyltransferase [bacterium]